MSLKMIEILKSELIPLIVDYYRKQLQESTYQIYTFQQKYGLSFIEFEKRVKESDEEDFKKWDDYISWKGHMKSAEYISDRIQKIENGLFRVP